MQIHKLARVSLIVTRLVRVSSVVTQRGFASTVPRLSLCLWTNTSNCRPTKREPAATNRRLLQPARDNMDKVRLVVGSIKAAFTSSGIETPAYEVPAKHEEYEERDYEATVWVSTQVKAMSHKEAVNRAFRRLFEYIQGKNVANKVIPMTAPVATKVEPGAGPNCESTFTMSFFVGVDFQEKPPEPSSPDVFIQRWGPVKVFARVFSGFAEDEDWINQARTLSEVVPSDSKYIKDYYYTCGYDAPFKLFNRKNEIWFIKES